MFEYEQRKAVPAQDAKQRELAVICREAAAAEQRKGKAVRCNPLVKSIVVAGMAATCRGVAWQRRAVATEWSVWEHSTIQQNVFSSSNAETVFEYEQRKAVPAQDAKQH